MSETERPEGRSALQIRTMMCERGVQRNADGSAEWTQDRTRVVAAVYGPQQTTSWKEHPERAVVDVIFRQASGGTGAGAEEKRYESMLRKTLEGVVLVGQFPRTLILLVLQVVYDDGGVLASALNAACLALLDAGIPMKHLFVTGTVALTGKDELIVDPDARESQGAKAMVVATYAAWRPQAGVPTMAVSQDILACLTVGAPIDPVQLLAGLELSRNFAVRVANLARSSLEKALAAA
eukprot:jgi/Botrbrau1/2759/Bobra.0164s0038.1